MASLKIVGKVLITALTWAVVWGMAGEGVGVVGTIIDPDTGHIPRQIVPVMIGIPSAAFGAVAGLIFASITTRAGISTALGAGGRTIVGCIIGEIAGIVFMNILAHSIIAVVLAALLGAALGARITRPESLAGNK
jgi:hypothetical protein